MKPLVGITAAHVEEEISTYPRNYYVEAIIRAGGVPLILPVTGESDRIAEEYLQVIKGLVLSGGSDVDPAAFGQEPIKGTGRVYPERDCFELEIAQKAVHRNIPVLGICRGMQVLNIAMGGDIFQDVPSQVPGALEHVQKGPRDMAWHNVELSAGQVLRNIFTAKELRVNSFHHQAVNRVAHGFIAAARAKDGVIEAIESQKHRFAVGVQWHPEAMVQNSAMASLFSGFIAACAINNLREQETY